eukprot:GHVS01066920.1.p1 GENE.GHVS01066920.1~~GHVS01066920.1.p1  ORF type:complete len:111 (+),score=26.20 GHVS01066920.1:710-1042(+)
MMLTHAATLAVTKTSAICNTTTTAAAAPQQQQAPLLCACHIFTTSVFPYIESNVFVWNAYENDVVFRTVVRDGVSDPVTTHLLQGGNHSWQSCAVIIITSVVVVVVVGGC